MKTIDEILNAVRALPEDQKQKLTDLFLAEFGYDESDELSPELKAEIERRLKEIDSGEAELISWEDVQDEINREFGYNVKVPS